MKTSQIFIISAIIISGTFFGVLSLFELPQSVTEWVISDTILGVILYVSYLVIAMVSGSSKKVHFSSKRVAA
ncbi:MAG: C4-dicarboxylate ABC transporter [Nitrosomonas sp.]|nr:C4-dicarboxylate ABC transporter [Nitrosomonas sp.]